MAFPLQLWAQALLAGLGGTITLGLIGRWLWLSFKKQRELAKLDEQMTSLLREALGDSERVRKMQKELVAEETESLRKSYAKALRTAQDAQAQVQKASATVAAVVDVAQIGRHVFLQVGKEAGLDAAGHVGELARAAIGTGRVTADEVFAALLAGLTREGAPEKTELLMVYHGAAAMERLVFFRGSMDFASGLVPVLLEEEGIVPRGTFKVSEEAREAIMSRQRKLK